MNGAEMNKALSIGARHALYGEDGKWYHPLRKFPGVLFDKNGYLIIATNKDYHNNRQLQHSHDLHIRDGISSIHGYIPFSDEQKRMLFISGYKEIDGETIRIIREINTIQRNSIIVGELKKLYKNTCQICGTRLKIKKGIHYSEIHHIKPLGLPHNGLDKIDNMICVCPNHHALLDFIAIKINISKLKSKHSINREYVKYHNERYKALFKQ